MQIQNKRERVKKSFVTDNLESSSNDDSEVEKEQNKNNFLKKF